MGNACAFVPAASFLRYRRRTQNHTTATAIMRITTPPTAPAIKAVLGVLLDFSSFLVDSEVAVEVAAAARPEVFELAPVVVPSRALALVLATSTLEDIVAPVSGVVVAVSNASVEELVVERSLITVAAPSVKTFESSLQHVLPSE